MAGSFEIVVHQNQTIGYTHSLYRADGTTGVALEPADKVRFKVARRAGSTPKLDLVSGAPTANGSNITIDELAAPARVTVTIAQADVAALLPGTYYALLGVVDDSEAAATEFRPVSIGAIHVIGAPAGNWN